MLALPTIPPMGQVRVSNELKKCGLFVSPRGVRSIWLRHNLVTFKKCLAALEKKAAEAQIAALEHQNRASRLLGGARYLLRRHAQGCGAHRCLTFWQLTCRGPKECAFPVLPLLQAVLALACCRSRRNQPVTDFPQPRPGGPVIGGATGWHRFALFPVFSGHIFHGG